MAASNREAAKNMRAIDDVPQKSELIQYEKRLEELYQQVLYFTFLYFTFLYFTFLYFTLLYFTLLYFTLLKEL